MDVVFTLFTVHSTESIRFSKASVLCLWEKNHFLLGRAKIKTAITKVYIHFDMSEWLT